MGLKIRVGIVVEQIGVGVHTRHPQHRIIRLRVDIKVISDAGVMPVARRVHRCAGAGRFLHLIEGGRMIRQDGRVIIRAGRARAQ